MRIQFSEIIRLWICHYNEKGLGLRMIEKSFNFQILVKTIAANNIHEQPNSISLSAHNFFITYH